MDVLALLTNRDDIVTPKVKTALKEYTLYTLKTLEEFEDLHINIPISLFLIDTVSHRLSQLGELLDKLDNDMVILITPEKPNQFTLDNMPSSVYGCVDEQSIRIELVPVVERALKKQRLKNMTELLKQTKDKTFVSGVSEEGVPYAGQSHTHKQLEFEGFPAERFTQKRALVNFAKMLTASFDMRKLFSHFMDSVAEIVSASKMSVMLKDKEGFHIEAHLGLNPYIIDNIKLKKDSALVSWLSKTGRIRHKPVNPADIAGINIKSEMELLQCIFSFPMVHKGKLIGIFNIDNKITDEPFYKEELEIIYVLCNYLAAAVKDIDLYHQILYQKEFTKNILSSMASGVIAIGGDEKITIFNQRASEILDLNPVDMIGSDLRSLPSPLGDILYETMAAGTSYKRHEIAIGPAKLPVGINSYRLLDENQAPIGAGIVFNDLSDSKRLEAEKRKTERLEVINDLMAKIAHEVRNPMTSIYTYTQLINEKYKDDELNNFYSTVVFQSIQKLDNLIDKLIVFSSKAEYNLNRENLNLILNESADYLKKKLPPSHKFLKQDLRNTVFINADRKLLAKAISYIVLSAVDRTPDGAVITLSAETSMDGNTCAEILIEYNGKEFTENDRQNIFKQSFDIDNLGAALNIPISHKIIGEHGGSLGIKSEGSSNTFIIKLPLMKDIKELKEEPING